MLAPKRSQDIQTHLTKSWGSPARQGSHPGKGRGGWWSRAVVPGCIRVPVHQFQFLPCQNTRELGSAAPGLASESRATAYRGPVRETAGWRGLSRGPRQNSWQAQACRGQELERRG